MSDAAQILRPLPPRARAPFEQLLRNGLASERAVRAAVKAATLARQPERAIAFLSVVHFLESQGIHVVDAIEMAEANGRRVRLDWSPRRWKEEHARLQRLETLRRFASENMRYELDAFRRALPAKWPGYLIQTSRRLGMEGLHQRHCVAAYHERILAGSSAIAVVFTDKKRWTVELSLSDEGPLRIEQVAGRFNERPTRAERARVRNLLGLPAEPEREFQRQARDDAPTYRDVFRTVLPVLRAHGVTSATAYFDGSGDTGTVDRVVLAPQANLIGVTVRVPRVVFERSDEGFTRVVRISEVDILEALQRACDDYADAVPCDWVNNDGGYGAVEIDVENQRVGIEVYVRHTESELGYSDELEFE